MPLLTSFQFEPIVGGPNPPIGSSVTGSTIWAVPCTSPPTRATPVTDFTSGSTEAGIGSRSADAPPPGPACSVVKADSARTITSEVPAASLNSWSKAAFIVSVSTKVPATKPTPSTTESAVSAKRSFFASSALKVARHMGVRPPGT